MRLRNPLIHLTLIVTSVAAFQNCAPGFIADLSGSSSNSSLGGSESASKRFTCRDQNQRGAAIAGLRRMTSTEISNTLRGILGDTVMGDSTVAGQLITLPSDAIINEIDDYSDLPQSSVQFALQKIAKRVVEMTESTASVRNALFGTCSASATVADTCVSAFLSSVGEKVYRRPLKSEETAALLKVYNDEGKNRKGLQSVLFLLLQSPHLAMHIEEGLDASGVRVRLSDYEVANRIAFMTTAAPPDAELLAAAKQGQLKDIASVKAHVTRILASSNTNARSRVASFLTFYAGVNSLEEPRTSVGLASGIKTAGLNDEMIQELGDYTDHIFWVKNGTFEDLMTSSDSFPRSDAMMKILGAKSKVATNGSAVAADAAHVGLLHRPAYLASASERTSPILRGVLVRREVLCTKIPDPPADAVDSKLADLEALENQTNRSRIDDLTGGPACIGCHALINPLGHLFENYNQLGQLRTEEIIYTDKGAVSKTWPVDTSVQNPKLDSDEPSSTALQDSLALARSIAKGRTAQACFVQKAFEFMRARHMDENKDGCALRDAEDVVKTGSLRDVLIESIANEDIFWRSNI